MSLPNEQSKCYKGERIKYLICVGQIRVAPRCILQDFILRMNADIGRGRTQNVSDRKFSPTSTSCASTSAGNEMSSIHLHRRQTLRLLRVEALDLGALNGCAAT
jgi:hypothetical protein